VYRNVPKNPFQNVGKCTEKTISKVIWVGKGTLDVILSQINKKIGDRFHSAVISETRKLSIFQLRHRQGQRVTRPAVSLRGGSKTGPGRRRKSSLLRFKTESIRELNNINFKWTKTFYQNNSKHTAFFLTLLKD